MGIVRIAASATVHGTVRPLVRKSGVVLLAVLLSVARSAEVHEIVRVFVWSKAAVAPTVRVFVCRSAAVEVALLLSVALSADVAAMVLLDVRRSDTVQDTVRVFVANNAAVAGTVRVLVVTPALNARSHIISSMLPVQLGA